MTSRRQLPHPKAGATRSGTSGHPLPGPLTWSPAMVRRSPFLRGFVGRLVAAVADLLRRHQVAGAPLLMTALLTLWSGATHAQMWRPAPSEFAPAAASDGSSEETSEAADAEDPGDPPPVVMAGWCPVRGGAAAEGDLGCDAGVGAALLRWRRLFLAAAVGQKSAAAGVGWTAYRGKKVVVAIAAGVMAPLDGDGIHLDGLAPAVGATFGLGDR